MAERGYYDGVIFHRVIKGFMVQGGDPTGTGRGGESAAGGRFKDEINSSSPSISAVTSLGRSDGKCRPQHQRFSILHHALGLSLPPNYTIFGRVTAGQEVVDTIANVFN